MTFWLFLAWIIGTTFSQGGTSPAAAGPLLTAPPTGAFFALSVGDVDASAKWYQETLGLHSVRNSRSPDGRARTVLLEGFGLIVELVQHADAQPLAKAAAGIVDAYRVHGIFKIGITVADFDAVYRRVKARGVSIRADVFSDQALGLRSVIVRDADGNLIQFFGR
jgi:catechol 2,3-dioxygenase-like lactoylglutathione lyase family enzyme